jgi:hypothetical protein
MQRQARRRTAAVVLVSLAILVPAARPTEAPESVEALLARIKAVGREGRGNDEAGKAWKQLVRLGPDNLPAILAAMDDDNPVVSNWLRTAVDAIGEHAVAARDPLPAEQLEKFVKRTINPAAARRLAYEWLARVDRTAPDRLLPGMLQDPSGELRRDAVGRVLEEAKRLLARDEREAATAAYRKALAGATDQDQVDAIANDLKALGVEVDLAAHFGFVRQWYLLGPFDNTGGEGFGVAYPPEKGVELTSTCKGKKDEKVAWVGHTTSDRHGAVDLNKGLGKHTGAAAYAFAVIESPARRTVQLRAGSDNALKVFLNGKEVFSREEYHHGMLVDQYVCTVRLEAGRNELLVKVCQNEQTEDWAQKWIFQIRICDAAGAAVPFTQPAAGKSDQEKTRP